MTTIRKSITLGKEKNFLRITNEDLVNDIAINKIIPHDEIYDGYPLVLLLEATVGAKSLILSPNTIDAVTSNLRLKYFKPESFNYNSVLTVKNPQTDIANFYRHTPWYNTKIQIVSPDYIDITTSPAVLTSNLGTVFSLIPLINNSGVMNFMINFDLLTSIGGAAIGTTFVVSFNSVSVKNMSQTIETDGRHNCVSIIGSSYYTNNTIVKIEGSTSSGTAKIYNATMILFSNEILTPGILQPDLFGRRVLVDLIWNAKEAEWIELSRSNVLS